MILNNNTMSLSTEASSDNEIGVNAVDSKDADQPLEVIIIGAGIAGLSLGIYLRQNGHRVRVSK